MIPVAALTVFALLLARVMRAPAGTWRYILGAAVAALLASQLLPAGNAYRADVAGSARTLFWLGLALAPVAAYAVVLQSLRRRAAAGAPDRDPPPLGLVQFDDDGTLAEDTRAALEAEARPDRPGAPLSLGWRGDGGALVGHLRLWLAGELAEIELLRVAPEARGHGVGSALLRGAEGEAVARGARRIGALVGDWQAPGFFARAGYLPCPDTGGPRRWMEKPL